VILLTHSPDFAGQVHDPRVKLVLAGHTHGGQIVLPLLGPPVIPSMYGRRYASGLVQADGKQVYISRGIGKAVLPFRFRCPPEVTVLTLQPALGVSSGR
jgi:predicted MPP superfamily phosphohydrolase